MTRRITQAAVRTSGVHPDGAAGMVRCILDSMALAIRHAVHDAARITGRPVRTVHVVGGGAANPLFCQLVADACGTPVIAGPAEAASWGNVLVQARALGMAGGPLPELPGLPGLRALVRRGVDLVRYDPAGQDAAWERAGQVVLSARAARS